MFWKLLFIWKASIYKVTLGAVQIFSTSPKYFFIHEVVWCNLLLYILLYSAISVTYRYLLSEEEKVIQINTSIRSNSVPDLSHSLKIFQTIFENIVIHCQTFADLIPVTFVLGFYVSIILARSEYVHNLNLNILKIV